MFFSQALLLLCGDCRAPRDISWHRRRVLASKRNALAKLLLKLCDLDHPGILFKLMLEEMNS
jgi:hypothetical protein